MSEKKDKATRSKRPSAGGPPPEMPFEKSLERLQEIVEALEAGDVSLEQSLALFEEGMALSRRCNQRLDTAERRIEVLVKKAEGQTDVEPFPEEEFFPDSGSETDGTD